MEYTQEMKEKLDTIKELYELGIYTEKTFITRRDRILGVA